MADEDNLFKQWKKITNTLRSIVECPICLDTVKVPFKQCATGHVLCSDCIRSEALTACPTCQEPFIIENPIIIKRLLEALPRLCLYSDDGCERILEPREDHEAFCGYRPITCRELSCTDTTLVCQLLKHYEEQHPTSYVIKSVEDQLLLKDFDAEMPRKEVNLVLLFNNLFWFNIQNDTVEKQLKFSFQVIPDRDLTDDYFVRVTLRSKNIVYSYTVTASVLGSDNEGENIGGDHQQILCKRVPQSELHHFVNDNGSLEYRLFFFKTAK